MKRAATLGRIHRVRTLQLGLARAEEMRQHEALAGEFELNRRIAGLVEAVAPSAEAFGLRDLQARAHYREKLHQSALAAETRVQHARQRADAATEASRAAERDQRAVEKLIDRARRDATMAEMRALQNAPAPSRPNRHDPC